MRCPWAFANSVFPSGAKICRCRARKNSQAVWSVLKLSSGLDDKQSAVCTSTLPQVPVSRARCAIRVYGMPTMPTHRGYANLLVWPKVERQRDYEPEVCFGDAGSAGYGPHRDVAIAAQQPSGKPAGSAAKKLYYGGECFGSDRAQSSPSAHSAQRSARKK